MCSRMRAKDVGATEQALRLKLASDLRLRGPADADQVGIGQLALNGQPTQNRQITPTGANAFDAAGSQVATSKFMSAVRQADEPLTRSGG